MSSTSLIMKKEGDYQVQGFNEINNELFDMIRKVFKLEPALGEVMFLKNQIYFTSSGCSRIAEVNNNKDIRFEYLDPETFPIPFIRKNAESFIIVKCMLTKSDGGIVDGHRMLNLNEERKYGFPRKCVKCGQESRYFRRTPDPKIKECSHCNEKITGYDMWIFANYCGFAETKAFMKAVKRAYNVKLFDDLSEEEKAEAKDVRQTIIVQAVDTKIEKSEEKKPDETPLEKLTLTKKESKKEPSEPREPTQEEEELIAQLEDFEKQVDTYDKEKKENQIPFEEWLKSLERKKIGQDTYCKTSAQSISDSGKAHQLKFTEFDRSVWFPNQYLVFEPGVIWIREWILTQKKKDFV